jgi:hypothetical membrane protein
MFKNIDMTEINKNKVKTSIWLILPVSSVIGILIALFNGMFDWHIFLIPFFILTYGAIIWIPSIIFTALLEHFSIRERSTEKTILAVFGIETTMTFVVMLLIFGSYTALIPFLALGMSVVIQLARWYYLKHNDRMFHKAGPAESTVIIDC